MSATQLTAGIDKVDRTAAALADILSEVAESLEDMRAEPGMRSSVDTAFRGVCRTRARAARFSRQLVAACDRLRGPLPGGGNAESTNAVDIDALEARVAAEQAALSRISKAVPAVRRSETYVAFRQRVWDVRNAERAMPPISDGSDASADEEDANGDADIAVAAQSTLALTCPVTRVLMVQPVRNRRCGHAYCLNGLQTLRNGGNGAQCPVAGCRQVLNQADLVRATDLAARLERVSRTRLFE